MQVCEVTVKFHSTDPLKTHTRTFTSFEGDWFGAHAKSNDYATKHFKECELKNMEHLNHASYTMNED